MRKANLSSWVVGISMSALILGVWMYGWFCHLNWKLRIGLLNGWSTATIILSVLCVFLIATGTSYGFSGHKLYRRSVSTKAIGQAVSINIFKTSGLFMTLLGGTTLAFGLRMLENSKLGTNGFGGQVPPAPVCGWTAVALGIILIGFRYSAYLDAAGGWLVQSIRVFGLGPVRRLRLGRSTRVRFLEEVQWSYPKGSSTRHLTRLYYLQLVDDTDVYNLNSDATPEAAAALAGYLHHEQYEHLICDYTGEHAPEDAVPVKHNPNESFKTLIPYLAGLGVILMVAIPYGFWYGVSQEKISREGEVQSVVESSGRHRALVEQASDLEGPFWELVSTEEARANYEKAISLLSEILSEPPGDLSQAGPYYGQALLGRARLQMKLGRFDKGVEDAERFRRLCPKDWNLQGRVSGVYYFPETLFAEAYWRTGKLDTALHLLEMRQDPDPALRGLILADLERWEEAEEALKSAKRKGRSRLPEGIETLEKRLKERSL